MNVRNKHPCRKRNCPSEPRAIPPHSHLRTFEHAAGTDGATDLQPRPCGVDLEAAALFFAAQVFVRNGKAQTPQKSFAFVRNISKLQRTRHTYRRALRFLLSVAADLAASDSTFRARPRKTISLLKQPAVAAGNQDSLYLTANIHGEPEPWLCDRARTQPATVHTKQQHIRLLSK